jgi:effector-binding domain-containing protein
LVDVRIEERDAIATAVAIVPDVSHWKEGLDRVWACVRANGLPAGRNVMRYGERVEVGVELDGFSGDDGLVASTLPAGPTAVGLRIGELSSEGIQEAHEAVRAWCASHGHEVTGECWEIYGHMNTDPFELLVGWPLSSR